MTLSRVYAELLTKGLIDPAYLKDEHLKNLTPESIKLNIFNRMVSELKQPLPEGVFKVCPQHGNLTYDDAKLMANGKNRNGDNRYSLRCNKCLMMYRRAYEIKNNDVRKRIARDKVGVKDEVSNLGMMVSQ